MTQLLSVGTKVRVHPLNASLQVVKAFEDLEGIITDVNDEVANPYYIINWNKPNNYTYKFGTNLCQFNMTASKVEAVIKLSKKDLICNKVIQLQKKFKERKLSYDF